MLLVAKVKSTGETLEIEVDPIDFATSSPGTFGWTSMVSGHATAGVCRETVYRWHESKKIPSFKIGSNIYCNVADLDAMEAQLKNQVRMLTVKQVPFPIRERAMERLAA
jgi:hypothetical protein